jgi:hypothetical protein
MKRNINIIHQNLNIRLNGFEPISLNNIDTLVDCSVDNIVYSVIESINKTDGKNIFVQLMQKLRPSGSLVVKFCDIKYLCDNFINNKISNDEFGNKIKSLNNILTLDEILTYIDIKSCKISHIARDGDDIVVTITKVSL